MRCLKRFIAREVYNSLRADLADTHAQPAPQTTTTIMCGAPATGSHAKALDIYRNVRGAGLAVIKH